VFDSHCHLHDLEGTLPAEHWQRALAAGVKGCLLAGVGRDGWQRQVEIALAFPECALSFGIHPQLVAEVPAGDLRAMLPDLVHWLDSSAPRAVALGEIGLDRGRPEYSAELPLQMELFRAQLALARERDLPVVLHVVDAHGLVLDLLARDQLPHAGGVMHSFSGSHELVRRYEALNLHISFSGAVCNPRATHLHRAVSAVSAARLLVETDAPYQTPMKYRPANNEPAFLAEVVSQVAALRGCTCAEIALSTEANARQLFGIGG
jgi:TatD DNase family protein